MLPINLNYDAIREVQKANTLKEITTTFGDVIKKNHHSVIVSTHPTGIGDYICLGTNGGENVLQWYQKELVAG